MKQPKIAKMDKYLDRYQWIWLISIKKINKIDELIYVICKEENTLNALLVRIMYNSILSNGFGYHHNFI